MWRLSGDRNSSPVDVYTPTLNSRLKSDWSEPQTFIIESVDCAGEVKSIIKEEGRQNDAVIAEIEQVVYLRGTGAVVAGTRGEQR